MSPPPPPSCADVAASQNGCADVDGGEFTGDATCMHCSDGSDRSPCYSSSGALYCDFPLKVSDSEKLRRIVTASAKGFSIGAGLKGGLALFSILARLRRRKALASLR